MTTAEMLEALTLSMNKHVQKIATDIIEGRDTIENQKTICGKFLQKVFEGNVAAAFSVADNLNKHAILRWLIEKGRQEDADHLIKKNYFGENS